MTPTPAWASNGRPLHFLTRNNTAASAVRYMVGLCQLDSWQEMTSSPPGPIILPPLLATYVEATNSFDLEGLLATFVDDALVNDQLRDYWGKIAIREWAERDIVGEKLTLEVTDVIEHYGNFIVTAKVDGNFDKRGLPIPLVLAFYFTVNENRIVQLIILRNRADI
jgi:hypothetical protein